MEKFITTTIIVILTLVIGAIGELLVGMKIEFYLLLVILFHVIKNDIK